MEGILYKWTNYWSGWQPRWFVLEEGLLTYYKSQDEVKQGCKGSVHLSACEIIVHPTDTMRIDIVIPYEQHFYLKAPSPQERHAWLVALGNAKAGLPPSIPKTNLEKVNSQSALIKSKKSELRVMCNLLMKQVYDVKTATNEVESFDHAKFDESTSLLSATCDSFIRSLEECMDLVEDALRPSETGEVVTAPITVLTKERKVSRSSTPSSLRQNSNEK